MTRTRQNHTDFHATAALNGCPPLDMLPKALAKVVEEIRDLTGQQNEALQKVHGLQNEESVDAAKAADRAEAARQIRAGKKGVVVQDAQRKLAEDTAAAEHHLDGINAAIEAAYKEFWELRDEADADPAAAATARKLAKAVQDSLDAFLAAYQAYDAHDMLTAWYRHHNYRPILPFTLTSLVADSRRGERAEHISVDIIDLVRNMKAEILDPRDTEA